MNQRFAPHTSRRNVLKMGVAAMTAATFAPSLARALDHGPEEYGGLPIGMQSYTLRSMSLENALKAMQNDLKLREVELYSRHIQGKSPKQVLELLKEHEVKCVSFGVVPFG